MEITANAVQAVAANSNVIFTDEITSCNNSILHRTGSGLVTLRGLPNGQCRSRFRIFFNGNIAAITTVSAISVAIAIEGEPILSTNMIATPSAVDEYSNVSASVFIDVPTGCCAHISVQNTTTAQSINIQNANLIVERIA